ncbi:MAG TPA: rhodanese-like domain-containing protein [Steroidobacteraceae bacterium]|nr:rhodanese-like domain-containing protein [Steroidobacteraceae bacterium]
MLRRCRRAFAMFVLCAVPAVSCLAQGAQGVAEPEGYWTGDGDSPTPSTIHGGSVIHVAELGALVRQGNAVIIDVSNTPRRPAELAPGAPWLPTPHRTIPGALWLPGAGAAAPAREVDDFYRGRLERATAGNTEMPVIVYCHEKCWLSWNAAKRAIGYGYRRVFWFPEGIEGWTAANFPTTVAAPQGPAAQDSR